MFFGKIFKEGRYENKGSTIDFIVIGHLKLQRNTKYAKNEQSRKDDESQF